MCVLDDSDVDVDQEPRQPPTDEPEIQTVVVSYDKPGFARTALQSAERHVRPRLDTASAEPQSEPLPRQTSSQVAPDGASSATA
eukprot:9335756-Pyramimonas_sp.AAC.1